MSDRKNILLPAAPPGGSGYPGEIVTYPLAVTNTGDTPDAYDVLVPSIWRASAETLVGALGPGESAELLVSVQIPAGALARWQAIAAVTVVSKGDGSLLDSSDLTTTAVWRRVYVPLINKSTRERSIRSLEGFYPASE